MMEMLESKIVVNRNILFMITDHGDSLLISWPEGNVACDIYVLWVIKLA